MQPPGTVDCLCSLSPDDEAIRELFELLKAPSRHQRSRLWPTTRWCWPYEPQHLLDATARCAERALGDEIKLIMLGERLLRRANVIRVSGRSTPAEAHRASHPRMRGTVWRTLALTADPGEDVALQIRNALAAELAIRPPGFSFDLLSGQVRATSLSLYDAAGGFSVTS